MGKIKKWAICRISWRIKHPFGFWVLLIVCLVNFALFRLFGMMSGIGGKSHAFLVSKRHPAAKIVHFLNKRNGIVVAAQHCGDTKQLMILWATGDSTRVSNSIGLTESAL